MNLGLEALNGNSKRDTISFEDFCIGSLNAATDLMDITNQMGRAFDSTIHLQELGCALERFGYTKSIDYLFGSNFNGIPSTEGIKEMASKVWEAIKEFFRKIATALRAVWNYFFGNIDKMVAKVEQRVKDIETNGVVERKVKIPGSTIVGKLYKAFEQDIKPAIMECVEAVKQLPQSTSGSPVEQYVKLAELVTSAGPDILEGVSIGADDNDVVTLNKQFAVGYGKSIVGFMKLLIMLKPAIKTVTENFDKLAKTAVGMGVSTARANDEKAGEYAEKAGTVLNILIDSPQGKEAIKKICTYINKTFAKAVRFTIAAGSSYLSVCKVGKGSGNNNQNATANTPEPAKNTLFKF